jgi:hypothetical protein
MLNLLNWRHALRQRLNAVVAAVAASAGCCLCGLVMTFVMAPRQALHASSIARLPLMGLAEVQAAAPGDTLLVTGLLAGNSPARAGSDLVAYTVDEWSVTLPVAEDSPDAPPRGAWKSHETQTAALTLELDGQPLELLSATGVRIDGALHEELVPGDSQIMADDNGEPRPDGTLRYRGLADGDLATVLGEKATTGGVTPEELFAGDRTAFEASQRAAASNFLIGGIALLLTAPVILVGGMLAALLGRRR